jgi:hypothetical protein
MQWMGACMNVMVDDGMDGGMPMLDAWTVDAGMDGRMPMLDAWMDPTTLIRSGFARLAAASPSIIDPSAIMLCMHACMSRHVSDASGSEADELSATSGTTSYNACMHVCMGDMIYVWMDGCRWVGHRSAICLPTTEIFADNAGLNFQRFLVCPPDRILAPVTATIIAADNAKKQTNDLALSLPPLSPSLPVSLYLFVCLYICSLCLSTFGWIWAARWIHAHAMACAHTMASMLS